MLKINSKSRLLAASNTIDPYKVFDYNNLQSNYPDIVANDKSAWYYKKDTIMALFH